METRQKEILLNVKSFLTLYHNQTESLMTFERYIKQIGENSKEIESALRDVTGLTGDEFKEYEFRLDPNSISTQIYLIENNSCEIHVVTDLIILNKEKKNISRGEKIFLIIENGKPVFVDVEIF